MKKNTPLNQSLSSPQLQGLGIDKEVFVNLVKLTTTIDLLLRVALFLLKLSTNVTKVANTCNGKGGGSSCWPFKVWMNEATHKMFPPLIASMCILVATSLRLALYQGMGSSHACPQFRQPALPASGLEQIWRSRSSSRILSPSQKRYIVIACVPLV